MHPYLEEVVFEEVPHGLVGGDVPPRVEVEVQDVEPSNKHEGREFRLVPDRHQDHQDAPDNVLENLEDERKSGVKQARLGFRFSNAIPAWERYRSGGG